MSGIKDAKKKRGQKQKLQKIRIRSYTFIFIILCLVLVVGIRNVSQKRSPAKDTKKVKTAASKDKSNAPKVEIDSQTVSTSSKNTSKEDPVTLTVSSMGDCTLGTDANFDQSKSLNAYYAAHGADYFFQNVRSILAQDDLSIVNMEGTLTTQESRADKTYAFKADPEYVSILTGGSVEAANLANNHSQDYGEKSFTDTKAALKGAGIATFGYDRAAIVEIKGVKVGLTGIYELADHDKKKLQVKGNIAALKKAGAQLIIVNFHWGIEREYTPDDTQKMLAHLAIDMGADLVIGHHPHVLQPVEKYKGKYIAYSLGNFCFGGNSNPDDKDTLIFQQTFSLSKGNVKKDDNINVIPCSCSSSPGLNDYCPTPVDKDAKTRVMEKLGL